MLEKILIGYDSREPEAYHICKKSIIQNTKFPLKIIPLKQDILKQEGIYKREFIYNENGVKVDKTDKKPFSTEFSFTRFLVPFLSNSGWVLFCDSDMLFRADILGLLKHLDDKYAVMVVKHTDTGNNTVKMDGMPNEQYWRKNWSSFCVWNLNHPANTKLTLNDVNKKPGSWLHGFNWLTDDEIGELPIEWNWLEGISPEVKNPKVVHYTRGIPNMTGYEDSKYSDEWFTLLAEYEREEHERNW